MDWRIEVLGEITLGEIFLPELYFPGSAGTHMSVAIGPTLNRG